MRERRRGPGDQRPAAQVQRGDRPVRLVRSVPVPLRSSLDRLRGHAASILRAAVDAVEPVRLLRAARERGALDCLHGQPLFVVAAGKAAVPMAQAFRTLSSGRLQRVIVAGPGEAANPAAAADAWYAAGHPLPNEASVHAGIEALDVARQSRDGWLIVLLSGGASAMLAVPAPPLTLRDKAEASRALLNAGVPIHETNCVRKHLSHIKGGRLAAAAGKSLTLAISDVHAPVEDDASVIGSGPAVADPSTFAEALEIARRIPDVPARVVGYLERGAAGAASESVKPGDARLAGACCEIVGNRRTAMHGAASAALALGYAVELIEPPTGGEARGASKEFVSRAHAVANAAARPLCVIAGGETTVRVVGTGKGGRNQEFALAATPYIARLGRAAVLASAGTDGTDGPTDAAGALVDSSTLERSQRAGLDWQAALANNDAYNFFDPLRDLLSWGATGTNVADIHVMLIA